MKVISLQNDFLPLLFSEGSATCFTESPHGYKVRTQPYDGDPFFCINELHPTQDLKPTKDWHDANLPRRADCNVVCYRNFLIELDNMPLDEQITYVRSRLPVSTITYSGGSSYHFIISLETPLKSLAEYTVLAKRILDAVPEADPSCKNPSRLSRLPGPIRPDTGKAQDLVYLGSRIKLEDLEPRLPAAINYVARTFSKDEKRTFITPLIIEAIHEPDAVMQRSNMTRNLFFYWLHNRFEDLDLPYEKRVKYVETAYSNLKNTYDFTYTEACMAARVS